MVVFKLCLRPYHLTAIIVVGQPYKYNANIFKGSKCLVETIRHNEKKIGCMINNWCNYVVFNYGVMVYLIIAV